MKLIAISVLCLALAGCSNTILDGQGPISNLIQNDVQRAAELLAKYGNPTQKRCGEYLLGSLAAVDPLKAEDTKGLVSLATKKLLLAGHIKENQGKFMAECGPMAAEVMLMVAGN